MSSERQLSVSVKYGEVEVNFSGSPEVVIRSLHEFISKQIPNMDLARSISVNYSLNDLIKMFGDFIRFTEEGPRVWAQERKLSDKDLIALQLVSARAANLSGKSKSDAMTTAELESATGLYAKTIGSRLSELNKLGHVERNDSEGTGRYRVTTLGLSWLSTQLAKKYPKQPQAVGAPA